MQGRQAATPHSGRREAAADLAPAPSRVAQDPPGNRRVLRVSGTFGPSPMGPGTLVAAARARRSVECVHERRIMLSLRVPSYDARGQTAAEYLGVLLVVAVIIAGAAATGPGQDDQRQAHGDRARHLRRAASLASVLRLRPRGRAAAGVRSRGARADDRHAQPGADRARRVEVDERGRGQRRHAPGRGQAGRRRARRPAAQGRAARPARLRLQGERGLARGGLQGHRADVSRRAARQGRAAPAP